VVKRFEDSASANLSGTGPGGGSGGGGGGGVSRTKLSCSFESRGSTPQSVRFNVPLVSLLPEEGLALRHLVFGLVQFFRELVLGFFHLLGDPVLGLLHLLGQPPLGLLHLLREPLLGHLHAVLQVVLDGRWRAEVAVPAEVLHRERRATQGHRVPGRGRQLQAGRDKGTRH